MRKVLMLLVAVTAFMAGCAGPKYGVHSLLNGSKDPIINSKPPLNKNIVVISGNCLGSYNEMLKNVLVTGLGSSGKFKAVSGLEINEVNLPNITPDLKLIIDSCIILPTSWGQRAVGAVPTDSEVHISGRLVNTDNASFLSFNRGHKSPGGLFGLGGFATAGADSMIESQINWVADDIVGDIESAFDYNPETKIDNGSSKD